MVQWADSPLDQAQSHVVVTHWDDIARHLAPPTVAWEWTESKLGAKTRHQLKTQGLIKPVSGGMWRATEHLWLDVIDRAGDNDTVGCDASGQELLVEPVADDRATRTLTDPDPRPTIVEQQTLTGDTTELDNDGEVGDRIARNRSKAEHNAEDESEVAPGQLRLDVFEPGQTTIGAWTDILGARDRGAA